MFSSHSLIHPNATAMGATNSFSDSDLAIQLIGNAVTEDQRKNFKYFFFILDDTGMTVDQFGQERRIKSNIYLNF